MVSGFNSGKRVSYCYEAIYTKHGQKLFLAATLYSLLRYPLW